jgi:hypothetical protein
MALADIEALPFPSLDDDSFNLEIFESNNGPINFNTDRLMSFNYNPFFCECKSTSHPL